MQATFLSDFKERGYFNQCTDMLDLENVMSKNSLTFFCFPVNIILLD